VTAARPRVLVAIAGLPAGGAERQTSLLLRGVDRDRFEMGLLIFGRRERVFYPEVFDAPLWFRSLELRGAGPTPGILLGLRRGIAAAVRDFQPDLVQTVLNVANHAVRATAIVEGWRVPVCSSVRVDFLAGYRRAERLAERLLAWRSARVVCNSEAARSQVERALRLPPGKAVLVRNGIDPRFVPGPPGGLPPWWPAGGRTALSVGRFVAQKNQAALIDAFAALDRRGAAGDWTLAVVGEGPLEAELRARAAASGRIVVAPPVADPRPLYRAASLFVLPSAFEGLPNALLEAQACGCPAAATPGAAADGALAPGASWTLEGDLADALAPVLALPPEALAGRGRDAAEDMARRFSAAAMVAATEAVWDGCLGRAPAAP